MPRRPPKTAKQLANKPPSRIHYTQEAPRCAAIAQSTGRRCEVASVRGQEFCVVHGGTMPNNGVGAKLRIAMLVQPAIEVQFSLLIDPKTPANVRANVAADILDRAGFKAVERKEVDHRLMWFQKLATQGFAALSDQELEESQFEFDRLAYGEKEAIEKRTARQSARQAEEAAVLDVKAIEAPAEVVTVVEDVSKNPAVVVVPPVEKPWEVPAAAPEPEQAGEVGDLLKW